MAGLAELFMRTGRSLGPLPAPFVINRATLWADRGLMQLFRALVWIGHGTILGAPPTARACCGTGQSCGHTAHPSDVSACHTGRCAENGTRGGRRPKLSRTIAAIYRGSIDLRQGSLLDNP